MRDARGWRRRLAPAALTIVTAVVYSCSDCKLYSDPGPPALLSGYALTSVEGPAVGAVSQLPALYRTEASGRRLRIFADTLRFFTADNTYTESGRIGTQNPSQAEVQSAVVMARTPFTIDGLVVRLPQFVTGPATATVGYSYLDVATSDGQTWQYFALPDAR